MKPILVLLFPILLTIEISAAVKILNVRGGEHTGGFLEGGSDEHLSSFKDYTTAGGNHSWGEFADALKAGGFEITEVREGANKPGCDPSKALPCSDPVNFDSIGLAKFDIVIMGSNNSRYSAKAVATLLKFVDEGGGAIFMSDANFGRDWADAPGSDQSFLDSVGWVMNQDGGTYAVDRSGGGAKFAVPDHAILKGVNSFDGEGVSPITVAKAKFNGFTSTVLALAKGDIHRNPGFVGGGAATANDASLCVAIRNKGRIVGHFDRNTFFNKNGAGTDLGRFDNKTYGLNMMKWVSEGRATVSVLPGPKDANRFVSVGGMADRGRIRFFTDPHGSISNRVFIVSGRVIPAYRGQN